MKAKAVRRSKRALARHVGWTGSVNSMYFVYCIRSINYPDQIYIGLTINLKKRLLNHNSGTTEYTTKYKPWKYVAYFAFENKDCAFDFERYLKSGSGRAFIAKRLLFY